MRRPMHYRSEYTLQTCCSSVDLLVFDFGISKVLLQLVGHCHQFVVCLLKSDVVILGNKLLMNFSQLRHAEFGFCTIQTASSTNTSPIAPVGPHRLHNLIATRSSTGSSSTVPNLLSIESVACSIDSRCISSAEAMLDSSLRL